ncbi:MAG: ferredoxin [Ilumatobacter sp.]|nr:ferredoxin [Ilumatobacter sp.]
MRVTIDADKCIGSGSCEMLTPEVFYLNNDGVAEVVIDSPGPELEVMVKMAVDACPAKCIRMEEG